MFIRYQFCCSDRQQLIVNDSAKYKSVDYEPQTFIEISVGICIYISKSVTTYDPYNSES